MNIFVFVSEISKFTGDLDISISFIWVKGKKWMSLKIFMYGLYMKIMTIENKRKPPRQRATFPINMGNSWFTREGSSGGPIYGEGLSLPRLPWTTSWFSSLVWLRSLGERPYLSFKLQNLWRGAFAFDFGHELFILLLFQSNKEGCLTQGENWFHFHSLFQQPFKLNSLWVFHFPFWQQSREHQTET